MVDRKKEPDGKRISWKMTPEILEDFQFEFVFFDEAQCVRNSTGYRHHGLRLLKCRHLCWVTGTTLHSHPRDLLAALKSAWKIMGLDGWREYDATVDNSWLGLYHADYDPHQGGTYGGIYTPGIFETLGSGNDESNNRGLSIMKEAFEQDQQRLWLLDPALYLELGEYYSWDMQFTSVATASILRQVLIRRTRSSRLVLPNGKVTYAGADLPPCRVFTEELSFGVKTKRIVRDACDAAVENLTSLTNKGEMQDILPRSVQQASGVHVHFDVFRKAVLYSHDSRNIGLLDKSLILPHNPKLSLPVLGTAHVEYLIETDPLGGLDYHFRKTRESPFFPCPTRPEDFIRWFLATNPVMTRVFELMTQYVARKKKRVLIYCGSPWIQQ